jgi:hypothetical protein
MVDRIWHRYHLLGLLFGRFSVGKLLGSFNFSLPITIIDDFISNLPFEEGPLEPHFKYQKWPPEPLNPS